MILQPPKTIQDFENIEKSILELIENPFTNGQMYISLKCRLIKCREKIEELKQKK